MIKKVRSSDSLLQSSIDVFEGVKRALLRRGYIPKKNGFKKSPPVETSSPASKQSAAPPTGGGPEELIDATHQSQDILFKAESIFPFVLFPDTITLDREKITIAERFFFRVAKITSVPVRDILSVEADVGPFFGSIKIASRYFITNPQKMTFLWRKDAIELRRLLQGYIIVHEREIDCSSISKEDLIEMLKDLGQGQTG